MKWTRRDLLIGLGGLPILGAVWWAGAANTVGSRRKRSEILEQLNITPSLPPAVPGIGGEPVRVGIIGFGIRGEQLCRALGFATENWKEQMRLAAQEDANNHALEDFMGQEKLNVKLVGICDVFDVRADNFIDSFSTPENPIKRYITYKDMIGSGDVDAVVIATPDHWHAPISIEALNHNVHVYVEKPMTHTVGETYLLRDAAKNSKAVLAVGHQHRQTLSFSTARDIVEKGTLGHVSLIQTNTNRNDDNGAWNYDIHEKASPETIDWEQFLGSAPNVPFNKNHFFRWRKWWAYGSGLSGDLLTHDYDRLNCVLNMGIPSSVSASGGIYTHNDGRNVPDVIQVNMEFPDYSTGSSQAKGKEKGMTFCYSATLGNGFNRPTILMGHDATMELGNKLTIWPDGASTRYAEMIEAGKMNPGVPIYQYNPAANVPDAISSATSQYFADKGLMWTYIDGVRVDSTFLHMREWLSVIKNGGKVSCGINEGFEEAISAHMAGLSWKLGRKIEWDPNTEMLKPIEGIDFDEVLLANGTWDVKPEMVG
ncbi:Gfo/Idh/MocA family protein [Flagellimonas aequoris]|uniref:Gfo/Idh/MocA family oxidoreductase n=1 Tax=Flagellimonas aequoris TaxID=2306997 RepID=A0A418N2P5_9FLAO|nr:Gfo/Idh/MocA family oxidoreductase [Allomuricauda aequoris]RIV67598.1 gfo/Idh/MocA family oxidoreductase [Allomuricauda aequoris]TXJ99422.1 Gfo/Idh/MocA family oxidoreductase [Allomuricauda aequoris]